VEYIDKLAKKVDENSTRLTRLEALYQDSDADNKRSHNRIEKKVDAIALELVGFKYMAKGARWIVGISFGLGVWFMHEWELLKRLFK
jgi:hypothetical protein